MRTVKLVSFLMCVAFRGLETGHIWRFMAFKDLYHLYKYMNMAVSAIAPIHDSLKKQDLFVHRLTMNILKTAHGRI